MAEENKIITTSEAVKGTLQEIPVYRDAIQPGAKQIGTAIETLGKGINALLLPVRVLIWGFDQIEQLFLPVLQEKLKNIDQDRLISPQLTVAGPVLESLRFTGSEPTLRQMYVNLLATAMDRETAEKAHPAFVEIVRQLTPDEARLLTFLKEHKSIDFEVPHGTQDAEIAKRIGIPAKLEHRNLLPSYFENLERLRLIHVGRTTTATRNGPKTYRFSVSVSVWGDQFYAACMN